MNTQSELTIQEKLGVENSIAKLIIEKAQEGGEIETTVEDWVVQRFLPQTVIIDEVGYTKMCVNALKAINNMAATDYGSSRQRDLGQLWADTTRGYLGEYAFTLFLQKKGIIAHLNHELGHLSQFLPTDIPHVETTSGEVRVARCNISIKTSKWNGIWLDIPNEQFSHSDFHVFVKVGTGRDHLFAFLKHLSVFKDKVLQRGEDVGAITKFQSAELYDALPNFSTIPAYICGFVSRHTTYQNLDYQGKSGRKNFTVTGWNGPIFPDDLERIREREQISGKVQFTSIGTFAHNKGYLFNSGRLHWQESAWKELLEQL